MDARRFDAITRTLTRTGSRRSALSPLLGGVLGLFGWRSAEDAAAHDLSKACKKKTGKAKKKCLKKAKAHNRQHALENAPAGCPDGQRPCRGSCIGAGQCCAGADCPSGVCNSEGVCLGPGCADRVRNGDESDIDCGGSCLPCGIGKTCSVDDDCQSGSCCGGVCRECCGETFRAECPADQVCQARTCQACSDTTAAANYCDRTPGRVCGNYTSGNDTVLCFCVHTKSGGVVCTDIAVCQTCTVDTGCDPGFVCADAPGCCQNGAQTVCLRPGCPSS